MPRGTHSDGPYSWCVSYEEAFGERPDLGVLPALTAALPMADAAGYLSALGAALDMPGWDERQLQLADRWLAPGSVAANATHRIAQGSRDCWLHAGTVVAGWRALALWGKPDARVGDDLPRLFTKWLFLLSDAYHEAQVRVLEPTGRLADIAFVLQNTWAHHREDVFHTLSRHYSLLFEMPSRLRSQDSLRERVDAVAPTVLGASLPTCLAMGVVLWVRCFRQWAADRTDEDRIRSAVVDTGACFGGLGIPLSRVQRVLDYMTQTFPDLRAACSAEDSSRPWHPRDLLAVRARPLVAFGPTGVVAYTLPRHVVEAFTTGLYHRLSDHFREPEARRDDFRTYWGKLVEAYTGRLLEATFPVDGPSAQSSYPRVRASRAPRALMALSHIHRWGRRRSCSRASRSRSRSGP